MSACQNATYKALGRVLVRHLRLVERLVRRVLQLARALKALQDVLVRDHAVADKLDGRAGNVAQVGMQDRLGVRAADLAVSVLVRRRVERTRERILAGRREVDVLEDNKAVCVEEALDAATWYVGQIPRT